VSSRFIAALSVAVALALPACSGLRSGVAPDHVYVLRTAPAAEGQAVVPGVLAVLRPALQPGLDTDRIALARAGNEIDYYAASRWGESLPRVVSAFAVQSLAGSGGFAHVVSAERTAVVSDYELLLTVRRFEADYAAGGLPVARVTLECVLTAGAPRRVVGRCDAEAAEPAGANRMGEIVAALERAAQRVLADIRTRAVATAQAARQ
jgi:cholesterol transport system auxiliary component